MGSPMGSVPMRGAGWNDQLGAKEAIHASAPPEPEASLALASPLAPHGKPVAFDIVKSTPQIYRRNHPRSGNFSNRLNHFP